MNEDWIEVELGEVCEAINKVKRNEVDNDKSFLYLDIGGIDNKTNKIVSYKTFFWKDAPSRAQQIVSLGDTLFSTVRTYLKNIAIVNNPLFENQVCSSGFTVIRGKKDFLDSNYIFYYSLSELFLQPLNALQQGSSYPAVRDKDVFTQIIPLPPLPIQRAIVSKIEALFSDLDNGIANLKKAQAQLKIYRQAVLKKAFEGELTKEWRALQQAQGTPLPTADELLKQIKEERQKHYAQQLEDWKKAVKDWETVKTQCLASRLPIPQKPSKPAQPKELPPLKAEELEELPTLPHGWAWVKFNELLVSIRGGTTLVPIDTPTQFPILRSSSIRFNRIDFNDVRFIKVDSNINKSDFIMPNDLLFTRLNGTVEFVGNCVKINNNIPKNLLYPDRLYCAKVCNPKYSTFAALFFLSPSVRRIITDKAKSTAGHKRISISDITEINYAFCSLREQAQIVAEIERRLSVCDKVEQSISESLAKAESLRQSILKKAFEGKLLSQSEIAQCKKEVDYEPASELLKKIKAEKLAKEQPKKKTKQNG